MKKLLRFELLIFLVVVSANIQAQLKIGPKVGLNLSGITMKFDGKNWPMNKMVTGFQVGVISEIPLIKNFSLQPGILYSTKGFNYKMIGEFLGMTWTFNTTSTLNYVEIPVNVAYSFDLGQVKISLLAGPYLAYAISGKRKSLNETDNEWSREDLKFGSGEDDYMKAFDFGLNGGAGVNFRGLFISAQYGLGLANIAPASSIKDSNGVEKNRVIGISLSYLFIWE